METEKVLDKNLEEKLKSMGYAIMVDPNRTYISKTNGKAHGFIIKIENGSLLPFISKPIYKIDEYICAKGNAVINEYSLKNYKELSEKLLNLAS